MAEETIRSFHLCISVLVLCFLWFLGIFTSFRRDLETSFQSASEHNALGSVLLLIQCSVMETVKYFIFETAFTPWQFYAINPFSCNM